MLQVDKASVYFGAGDGRPVHALDNVSLDIPNGGFVVALGTSGCGKSTLLNAMAGFLPLSSGSITLNGHAVEGPGAERGVVFQKDTLMPWRTVVENVAIGLKFAGVGRKERRERALDLLRLVGLLLTGIRIALGVGWGTLVAAELIAATRGIGHFIMSASQFLATDFVFVGIGIIALCAFSFSFAMRLIERWLVPWKGKS